MTFSLSLPLKPPPIPHYAINNNINNNKNVFKFSSIKKWGKTMREEFSFFEQFLEHSQYQSLTRCLCKLLHMISRKWLIHTKKPLNKAISEFCTKSGKEGGKGSIGVWTRMWEISFSQLGRSVGSQGSLKNRKLIEEGADSDYLPSKKLC